MNLLISLSLLGMPSDAIERRKNIKHLRLGNIERAPSGLCGWWCWRWWCYVLCGLRLLGLTARIFSSSAYHWIARFYSKAPVLPNCNLLSAVPHATSSRDHIPLTLSTRLSKKMGFEAAVEATAVAAFLNKAAKPAILGGQNCELQMFVMPSAKGTVTEHHLHFICA